jgi:ABC-2 type transport system permease protein
MGVFAGHLDLADRIQTGDVVVDLYRPVDLQLFELATEFGRAAFQCTVRAVLPIVAGGLVFDLRLPSTPRVWLLFGVSLALGIATSFAHRFVVTLTTFWTFDYRAASQMAVVVSQVMSGVALPIVLFPSWLEHLARALPYVGLVQIPIEILLGKHEGRDLVTALGSQVLWTVGLLALGQVVLRAATRRVVVQGG